jgi:hypothetical protein
MECICNHCGSKFEKTTGAANRALKQGKNIYCNRACAGIGRRSNLSDEEKKAIKSDYDKMYREKNLEKIKSNKKEYFKRTYNPEEAKVIRKKRMPKHVAYCRRPEYREKKKIYDQKHRAQQNYGEFWESFLLVQEIHKEYNNTEVKMSNNLLNKNQKRKQEWKTQQANNLQLPR